MRGHAAKLAGAGWLVSLILGMTFAAALYASDVIGAPVLVGLALTTTALGALVPILRDADLTEHPVGRMVLATGAAGNSARSSRSRSSSRSRRASHGGRCC